MGTLTGGWRVWFLIWSTVKARAILFYVYGLNLLILSALVLLLGWLVFGCVCAEEGYLAFKAETLLRGYEILCVLWVTFEFPIAENPLSVVDLLSFINNYK